MADVTLVSAQEDFYIIEKESLREDDFEKVSRENSTSLALPIEASSSWGFYANIKSVARYTFSNIGTIAHNLKSTRTILTSERVLHLAADTSGVKNDRWMLSVATKEKMENLKASVQKQCADNETKITFAHLPISLVVSHSTMIAIVTQFNMKGEKENTILFFDPRGNHPQDARLLNPFDGNETVKDFYEELVKGMENPPTLLYSQTSIQGDVVSCTAYSAVFMEETCHAVARKENMVRYMQDVSNSQVVTLSKARAAVSHANKQMKAWG